MRYDDAGSLLVSKLTISREDVARAKCWLTTTQGGYTNNLADEWMRSQNSAIPQHVDTDAPTCVDMIANAAQACSLRLAFYRAVVELVSGGELVAASPPRSWDVSIAYKTSHGSGAIPLPKKVVCHFPERIEPLPLSTTLCADVDVFLQGLDCKTLHPGIREAVEQALRCYKRDLYMPATAMLAAAAEATWTECGIATAKKLSKPKLEATVGDQYVSISKKILEIQKTFEQPDGKALLQSAGQNNARVNDAELWTTALRERRNALHWTKATSFIADHSETGILLMAAPTHIGALEAIRAVC